MAREQEVQFEQDRVGNERRKLDTLRAREGMEGVDTDEGIAEITTVETGSIQTVYSLPTHAQGVILDELHAYNSQNTHGTYSLYELDLDSSGSITGSKRRSVPIDVGTKSTRINSYLGMKFDKAIGVESEFGGYIGVGVYSDHEEYVETNAEETGTP